MWIHGTEAGLRRRLSDASVRVTMIDGLTKGLLGIPPPETIDPVLRAQLPLNALEPPAGLQFCDRTPPPPNSPICQ